MPKCKNCIHYDVCQYHIDEETSMTVNECGSFKHNEQYVNLPAYIGQEAWRYRVNTFNKLVTKIKGKVSMLQQKADKSWKIRLSYEGNVYDYTLDDIGERIFFNEKEVDEKIIELKKEIENGNKI